MTTHQIKQGGITYNFLNSGDISSITYQNLMINQLIANPVDGSLNNLYFRIYQEDGMHVEPLVGIQSNSKVSFGEQSVIFEGEVVEVKYEVTFTLHEKGVWFWEINLEGKQVEVDVIYGQDLGISDRGTIRNNEAYVAQYIDHSVYEDEDFGYVVCSRQNQEQSTGFPYVQQGSLTKTRKFSTDGFQFFGLDYKETNQPAIYTQDLPSEVYQYEFAYTGLQSEKVQLKGSKQFVFYGLFSENHADPVKEIACEEVVLSAWDDVNKVTTREVETIDPIRLKSPFNEPLRTESLTMDEINQLYPNRLHEEWDEDRLLSFFTPDHEHIVLKEKELIVERPHGHILMTGNNDEINEETITTTTFMYGVFNSQLVIGNTNFNKLMSNTRNALNYLKTSGQRIYVEIDETYHLLTMPSVYEIGINYTRWYYKTKTETFVITTYTVVDAPEVHLEVYAESGKAYKYLVTNQITMNTNEYDAPYHFEKNGNKLTFTADQAAENANIYPDLKYDLQIEGAAFTVGDENLLASNTQDHQSSLVTLAIEESSSWNIIINGSLTGEKQAAKTRDFKAEKQSYRNYYAELMNNFSLDVGDQEVPEVEKLNTLVWWYTHNMLVHYSVPHGLEQYSGAAWGTRDVCQGPVEYFMAMEKYDHVREIIKNVYTHQFADDGNWPQWFMFDKYSHIKAGESHGDIIVWPLKIVADYLEVTNDYSILAEKLSYTDREVHTFTKEKYSLLEHIEKQIQYMRDHFLEGTHLSSYGDGDWNDTLQPANEQLKEFMVSSWTVALTYQVFHKLSAVIKNYDQKWAEELSELKEGIKADYEKYILQTDVVPGFIYMEDQEDVKLMLHPSNEETGISYRLLPMQRSIISELFTKEQADHHYELIQEKLLFTDGARLMDQPAHYDGGTSTHFQRAETAANFGREVGLQYVHAHIRFIEAMAKFGKPEDMWHGLATINPITIQDVVPNAERRQANTYFSSSDGKFNDRYEAQKNYRKLQEGEEKVKGGWRIYSSGPGIYLNQVISNGLGIRRKDNGLVIDPILPDHFDGLTFKFKINNQPVDFIYHLNQSEQKIVINGREMDVQILDNRYRQGGLYVDQKQLETHVNKDKNTIEIFV